MSQTPVSINRSHVLAFLGAGLIGLAVFIALHDQASPEAALDLKVSRAQAVQLSRDFLADMGFDLSGYQSAAVFDDSREEINFLERTLGLAQANRFYRDTVSVWYWRVRWFKEFEEVEYTVQISPDGRAAGFRRRLPQADPAESLEEDQARQAAEEFLRQKLGLDLGRYEYIERKTYDLPHRADQVFVWRAREFSVTDSEYRLAITVQGNRVGGFGQGVKIPEEYSRAREELGARRAILSRASYIFRVVLHGALLAVFFWRVYMRDIRWKVSFFVAGAYALIVILKALNELPMTMMDYPTTQGFTVFWSEHFIRFPFAAIYSFAEVLWVFAGAESIGGLLPDRPGASMAFTRRFLSSPEARVQTVMGYGLAFASLGYVTLYYYLGQTHLGFWAPVDVPVTNTMSTYFPAMSAIFIGVSASLNEELIYRLFAIALLVKVTKRPGLSILIPALVWGFNHTDYPQEPIWVRGLELTIEGCVVGFVFYRFGLLTTLVYHFVFNCFWGVSTQMQSGDPGLIANGLFALILPLATILAAPGLLKLLRKPPPQPQPDDQEPAPPISEPAPAADLDYFGPDRLLGNGQLGAIVLISVAMFGAGKMVPKLDFYGDPAPITMTKNQAAIRCEEELKKLGWDPAGFTSFTRFSLGTKSLPPYAIDQLGVTEVHDKYLDEFSYQTYWTTYWYQEKTIRTYTVSLDDRGNVLSFAVNLADKDPGEKLSEQEAGDIGTRFLAEYGRDLKGDWVVIETKRNVEPERWDYALTFRDQEFHLAKLERRLNIGISGNKVTHFGGPYFEVPREWLRKREIAQKNLFRLVQASILALIAAGISLFLLIQLIILFWRRAIPLSSLKWVVLAAVVCAVAQTSLSYINNIPGFYDGYYYSTAETLRSYTLERITDIPISLLKKIGASAFLFLAFTTFLRAWSPEIAAWKGRAGRLHPKRWGTAENLQGLVMGLAAMFFLVGLSSLLDTLKIVLEPNAYHPETELPVIALNQLSETLRLVNEKIGYLSLLLGILLFIVIYRRFVRTTAARIGFWVLLMMTAVPREGMSSAQMLVEGAEFMVTFIAVYLIAARIIRWNLMAYCVMAWPARGALMNWSSLFKSSPDIFWPCVQQWLWLLIPLAVFLAVALWQRARRPP